jgi:hypothetical protein
MNKTKEDRMRQVEECIDYCSRHVCRHISCLIRSFSMKTTASRKTLSCFLFFSILFFLSFLFLWLVKCVRKLNRCLSIYLLFSFTRKVLLLDLSYIDRPLSSVYVREGERKNQGQSMKDIFSSMTRSINQ